MDHEEAGHAGQVVLVTRVLQEQHPQAPRVAPMATLGARRPLPAA